MKTRLIAVVLLAFGIMGVTACANTDTDTTDTSEDGEMASSGMALHGQTDPDSDVAFIRFDIEGQNCPLGDVSDVSRTETKALEDMMLPGGIASFENEPFDEDSEHLFADAFFLVDQGCYDVTTTPLDENQNPSDQCEPAHAENVQVEDGATTEILLINQCEGVERGGLDVISAINHPPEVENLEFQKFRSTCPTDLQDQQICLTASDPDNDPLDFQWEFTGGDFTGEIIEVDTEQLADGRVRSCASVATTQVGSYNFSVTVFDLDGNQQRMEDLLSEQEGETVLSRDSLEFPLHAGVACPARRASILMAIGDIEPKEGPASFRGTNARARARQFIRQTAAWASPLTDKDETNVMYLLDDNNHGEHLPRDRAVVTFELGQTFNLVTEMVEPENGIDEVPDNIDLVWWAGVGWPPDDASTYDAIREFNQAGGGVVTQGNDMARIDANRDMTYFTGLEFLNNGTVTCGDVTDNYAPNPYRVQFTNEPVSAVDGLRGAENLYYNDIDHTDRTLSGERVLVRWSYPEERCDPGERRTGAAATAINPIDQLGQ